MTLEEKIKLILKKLTYIHGNRIDKIARLIIKEIKEVKNED